MNHTNFTNPKCQFFVLENITDGDKKKKKAEIFSFLIQLEIKKKKKMNKKCKSSTLETIKTGGLFW